MRPLSPPPSGPEFDPPRSVHSVVRPSNFVVSGLATAATASGLPGLSSVLSLIALYDCAREIARDWQSLSKKERIWALVELAWRSAVLAWSVFGPVWIILGPVAVGALSTGIVAIPVGVVFVPISFLLRARRKRVSRSARNIASTQPLPSSSRGATELQRRARAGTRSEGAS